ncbi:hypothetical protein H2199_008609 [Coniosporium tulheliwenetii]|uniref:Uncharacterized protein n=1 Tax=Coniosporium tulheliwenetii TaxID=3383036 RepID=A0ACC2YIL8_9PEZI|nr:hypothetical protein H2199_008609 [Cladosporium sp. JES 115]
MLKRLRSKSWVMLSEDGFTPLPGESTLYKSPNRTTLSLQSLNKFPGKEPFSIYSGAGNVYLTNRRLKMTFKDGGAFDFHNIYERIKERLQQAVEVARESGYATGDGSESGGGRGVGGLAGVDLNNVHLDELPAYEASGGMPLSGPSTAPTSPAPENARSSHQEAFSPPAEPPPGYEEVQRESVVDEVELRLRRRASRSST